MNDSNTNSIASVSDVTKEVLNGMRAAGYSDRAINYYRQNYDQLLAYMIKQEISSFSQEVSLQYLSARYDMPVEDFYSPQPARVTNVMRSLKTPPQTAHWYSESPSRQIYSSLSDSKPLMEIKPTSPTLIPLIPATCRISSCICFCVIGVTRYLTS